ncbi:hypothetical protein [Nitratireductor sp. OM-1]|uniref:hypothetical protein n=1 Tax=Nitratireductor sp. OM-1 TaxID=1756988 RepID=UPI000DDD8934|nr:hypothetical protein [Nitratireductor sp. OM-1]
MTIRNYEVSAHAIERGRGHGLWGDTEKRLRRMARRAAPVTSEHGNRRFNDWIMLVKDGTIQSVTRLFESR